MTVDRDAIERARMRLAETGEGRPDDAALQALLERARAGLEALAVTHRRARDGDPERLETSAAEGPARRGAAGRAPPRRGARPFGADDSPAGATPDRSRLRAQGARRGSRAPRRPDHLGLAGRGEAARPDRAGARPDRARPRRPSRERRPSTASSASPAPSRLPPASRSSKREPFPSCDSSVSSPPRACASSRAIGSPRPVPVARARPERPEDPLTLLRPDARARVGHRDRDRPVRRRASPRSIRPPSGVQANALSSRLETICSTRSPSVVDDRVGVERALVLDAAPARFLTEALVGLLEQAPQLDLLLLERELVRPPCARGRGRRRRGVASRSVSAPITASDASRVSSSSCEPFAQRLDVPANRGQRASAARARRP